MEGRAERLEDRKGSTMQLISIIGREAKASRDKTAEPQLPRWLAAAADGDINACFDLGVAYSTGSNGAEWDLIEAHKWFNLAAARGHKEAARCRAEIALDMTAREIAEAQRRAREFLASGRLCAA
jgi:TPR repeat protein